MLTSINQLAHCPFPRHIHLGHGASGAPQWEWLEEEEWRKVQQHEDVHNTTDASPSQWYSYLDFGELPPEPFQVLASHPQGS